MAKFGRTMKDGDVDKGLLSKKKNTKFKVARKGKKGKGGGKKKK